MLMKKREELQEMLEDFDNGEGNGEDGKDKNGKSSKDKMMGGGSFLDDHRKWEEGQGATDKEYVKEKVKQMIKDTYEKCKDFGSVPSSVVAQIAKIANESLINWKSELRKFSMFATKYASRESWRRRSRRFDKMKGRVIDPTLKVAVLVDTSGSMGEDDLAQISKELMVLYQSTKDIYVIECDAAVGKEYKFKGKIVKTWTGRGGTSFQPALDAAKKYKPDIIIYLTDGYPCDRPMKPKVPILWVITPDGVNDRSFVSFGKMVKMKNTDNNRMGR